MNRLVRGSTDRLRLEWNNRIATGPDGTRYEIHFEKTRHGHEWETEWFAVIDGREDYELPNCPYGFDNTVGDAKRICEYDAWVKAGKPCV